MAAIMRVIAYLIAMVLWLAFLPVWAGALGSFVTLMAVLIAVSLVSGRDSSSLEKELEEIAGLWPRGMRFLGKAAFCGRADTKSADIGLTSARFGAIMAGSAVFWALALFVINAF